MFGVKLEVEVLMIIGGMSAIENIYRVLDRLDIRNRSLMLQGLATSYAACDENDKNLGLALVDLGGVTDLTIYREGEIRYHRMLEIGSSNITKDVAIGLRTTFAEAERVKREFGVAMASMLDKDEPISVEDASGRGTKQASRRLLASVIEPRIEEILTLTNAAIRESRLGDNLSTGVVLSGGGSSLRGVDVLAEQVFGMPVRLVRPDRVTGPKAVTGDPAYATAVGLILCGLESKRPGGGWWSGMVDYLRGRFS
jgi:cell division protein FtsA